MLLKASIELANIKSKPDTHLRDYFLLFPVRTGVLFSLILGLYISLLYVKCLLKLIFEEWLVQYPKCWKNALWCCGIQNA